MKVSMISSSGKKYTKMAPIADWDEELPRRRNTEKTQKKKIFVNRDSVGVSKKLKNNSHNFVSEKHQELWKKGQATVIDIPKLFQKTKGESKELFRQEGGLEEGEKKLKKMRTINNLSIQK